MEAEQEAHQGGDMEVVGVMGDARSRIMEAYWFEISLLIAGKIAFLLTSPNLLERVVGGLNGLLY